MSFDDDDRILLARIAVGDEVAYEELYWRYCSLIHRYLWYHLDPDRSLIEEVLQDVFLAVWDGAEGFCGRSTVKTWLFGIANNRMGHMFENLKAQKRKPPPIIPLEDARTFSDDKSMEDKIQEYILLENALKKLPKEQRVVIFLLRICDLSYESAAQVLRVPVGTIKSRFHNGLRALRRLFQQDMGDEEI